MEIRIVARNANTNELLDSGVFDLVAVTSVALVVKPVGKEVANSFGNLYLGEDRP